MNWNLLWEVMRMSVGGAPIGDVALVKLAMISSPTPEVQERIKSLPAVLPEISIEGLRALEDGTLGREYARFLDSNGIEHLEISPRLLERFADNPFAVRYTLTHDLHHLLAGFDTGLAGEAGVAAFTCAQGTGYLSEGLIQFQRWVLSVLSPTQAAAVHHNVRVGLEMGREAELVVAAPLVEWLHRPLCEARERLGIRADLRASVAPSRRSLFARALYAAMGRELPAPPRPA